MNKELEEYAERTARAFDNDNYKALMQLVIVGAEWMQEKMFSEEDMRKMYDISCGNIGLAYLDDQTENNERYMKFLKQVNK
jgi:hypothetical protein